jgi:type II secretory pathway component PulF
MLPGVGSSLRRLETSRLTRNLGVMVSQGVPILSALEVVSTNIANATLRQAVGRVRHSVLDGSSLAAALAETKEFPVFVSNMVAVGEESGTVDAALLKVATTYERELDRALRTLTTILEPVLLVLVGGVVMFIVLAMLLPVFQLGLGVQ